MFKNGFPEKLFFLAYLKAYWENMKSLLCSSYFCLNVLNHSPYFICQKPNKVRIYRAFLFSTRNIPMICHSPRHVLVTRKVPVHVLMKCSRFLTEAALAFYAALQLSYLLPFFICSELFIAALTLTLSTPNLNPNLTFIDQFQPTLMPRNAKHTDRLGA